jgi:hypothetical protein
MEWLGSHWHRSCRDIGQLAVRQGGDESNPRSNPRSNPTIYFRSNKALLKGKD